MLKGLRNRIDEWFGRPDFDWIQVEVTTHCNARCLYCPTATPGADWPRAHMPLDIFRRVLPALARSAQPSSWRQPVFHLQGWGEPLLNPDFFTMAALAKRAGLRTSTTSNGLLIDDKTAVRIVESGIDILSLSVAGVDERNNAIRRGTRLEQVFDALAAIERQKTAHRSVTPAVHIAYMLLASGLDDVERIPQTFAGRGVEQIVISTLELVPDAGLFAEAIRPQTDADYAALDRRLGRVAEDAAAQGITLAYRIPPPLHKQPGLCAENIQAALVVTVDGQATPCLFNRFEGDGHAAPAAAPFLFGDLTRESPTAIWWSDPYRRFRRSFFDGAPPPRCLACSKLERH